MNIGIFIQNIIIKSTYLNANPRFSATCRKFTIGKMGTNTPTSQDCIEYNQCENYLTLKCPRLLVFIFQLVI